MTKYQDQNFTSGDILKSSLGIWSCHKIQNLLSINFYKVSNYQKQEKEGKWEVQNFDNLKDKRNFFVKIKSLMIIFWKFCFDGKNQNSRQKL